MSTISTLPSTRSSLLCAAHAATRRTLRANIGAARAADDETTDTYQDEEPRALGGGYRRHRPSPPSDQGHHRQRQSSVVTDALTKDESGHLDLARFLLMGKAKDGAGKKVMGMGASSTKAYALALEPIEIRREKIVMLAEAYAM